MSASDTNIRIHTNCTNMMLVRDQTKVIFPELSYQVTGILFSVHNELGRYGREKQYGNLLAIQLDANKISYKREFCVGGTGNIVDFIIEGKILIELKAKGILSREDYLQVQRYLQAVNLRLGLLVNFRNKYLRPIRIVKIDRGTH